MWRCKMKTSERHGKVLVMMDDKSRRYQNQNELSIFIKKILKNVNRLCFGNAKDVFMYLNSSRMQNLDDSLLANVHSQRRG